MKTKTRFLPLSLVAMALASLVACSAAPTNNLTTRKATTKKDAGVSAIRSPNTEDAGDDPEEQDPENPPATDNDAGTDPTGHNDSGTTATDAGGKDSAPPANAPTFATIYSNYLAPGTLGHCSGGSCHTNNVGGFTCGGSKASCYAGLVSAGLVSGTTSKIASANSPLTWFGQGGDMPTGGGTNTQAANAISAWVAAGALDN